MYARTIRSRAWYHTQILSCANSVFHFETIKIATAYPSSSVLNYYHQTQRVSVTCLQVLKCKIFTISSTMKFKLGRTSNTEHSSEDSKDSSHGRLNVQCQVITATQHKYNIHHPHHDAKRSAQASRRCDSSPERSVLH